MLSKALKDGLEGRLKPRDIETDIASYKANPDIKGYCEKGSCNELFAKKSFLKETFGLDDNQFKAIILYTLDDAKVRGYVETAFMTCNTQKINELSWFVMYLVSGLRKLPRCKTPMRFTTKLEFPVNAQANLICPFFLVVSTSDNVLLYADNGRQCYLAAEGNFIAYDTSNFTDTPSAILECGTSLYVTNCIKINGIMCFNATSNCCPQVHLRYMTPEIQYSQNNKVVTIIGDKCFSFLGAIREFCEVGGDQIPEPKETEVKTKYYLMPREEFYALNSFLTCTISGKTKLSDLVNAKLSSGDKSVDSFAALVYSGLERIGRLRQKITLFVYVDRCTFRKGYFVSDSFIFGYESEESAKEAAAGKLNCLLLEVRFTEHNMREGCVYLVNVKSRNVYLIPPNTTFYATEFMERIARARCIVKGAPKQNVNSVRESMLCGRINNFKAKIIKPVNFDKKKMVEDFREALVREKKMSKYTWVEFLEDPENDRYAYVYMHPCGMKDSEKLLNSMHLRVRGHIMVLAQCPRLKIQQRMARENNNIKWINVVETNDREGWASVELYEQPEILPAGSELLKLSIGTMTEPERSMKNGRMCATAKFSRNYLRT